MVSKSESSCTPFFHFPRPQEIEKAERGKEGKKGSCHNHNVIADFPPDCGSSAGTRLHLTCRRCVCVSRLLSLGTHVCVYKPRRCRSRRGSEIRPRIARYNCRDVGRTGSILSGRLMRQIGLYTRDVCSKSTINYANCKLEPGRAVATRYQPETRRNIAKVNDCYRPFSGPRIVAKRTNFA